ncbi:hypothetical protein AURDEDRAFT_158968 [Auricularia subglabra TFB-10046 SS5]|nr:hypothetical protein AURDEDRAFT_158968 [Auricularia subglabra TFB-10046 SS5]
MPPTLSKKEKKALAFRQKKKGGKPADDVQDVPEPDLDLDAEPEDPKPATGKRKREQHDTDGKAPQTAAPKGDDSAPEPEPEPARPAKKLKKAGAKGEDGKADDADDGDAREDSAKPKPKYILFLGNLRYTTTKEQIAAHFAACNPPPTIRLLTPKPKPGVPPKPGVKSKGCAFLEFASHNTLQQGLKLHGSTLDGRVINVELTAGGGGKSEARLTKVRERNKALLQERKKRLAKTGGAEDSELPQPQRHSKTSGEERVVAARKTWSIPEGDETAGRGGRKHAKPSTSKSKRPAKPWASGANAIAVE